MRWPLLFRRPRDLKVRTRELSANGGRKSRSPSRIEMFTAPFSFSQLSQAVEFSKFERSFFVFSRRRRRVETFFTLFTFFLRFASAERRGNSALWFCFFFREACTFGY